VLWPKGHCILFVDASLFGLPAFSHYYFDKTDYYFDKNGATRESFSRSAAFDGHISLNGAAFTRAQSQKRTLMFTSLISGTNLGFVRSDGLFPWLLTGLIIRGALCVLCVQRRQDAWMDWRKSKEPPYMAMILHCRICSTAFAAMRIFPQAKSTSWILATRWR
jgi:hypothetical protein